MKETQFQCPGNELKLEGAGFLDWIVTMVLCSDFFGGVAKEMNGAYKVNCDLTSLYLTHLALCALVVKEP